jgi:hypothetical protein
MKMSESLHIEFQKILWKYLWDTWAGLCPFMALCKVVFIVDQCGRKSEFPSNVQFSFPYRILKESLQRFMGKMERPFIVLCTRSFIVNQYICKSKLTATFGGSFSH